MDMTNHSHHHHHMGMTTTASPSISHGDHDMMGSHDMHGGHDHSQHSAMNSMNMDHSAHGGHMQMSFHFSYMNEVVLFDFWTINSLQTLILSMVGIFIISALYEGLKYFREYLFWKSYNALQYRSVQIPADKISEQSNNSRVVQPSMLSLTHLTQTGLHIVQITVSYLLMLIFMTYNVWLCLAVVAGAATGYFLFGWKKPVVVDVTEHCH